MTETSAAATAGFPDTTITFKYDYLGRRVEKKVVRGTTTESHLRFVWRGWLLVAELNAASNNALVKTYTWGPDISGSFGGAGGNGGVLMVEDHEADEKFFPAYDAQGNVTGLIDTSGNLDAAYEYDPFGKLIRYAGTRSTSMSLLYGTKYLDMETGLIYYGYRYYNPRQGRFINRDPIGEEGGINLYGFVDNNPVNAIDYLGLNDCGPRPIRPTASSKFRNEDYEKRMDRYETALKEWRDCISILNLKRYVIDGDSEGVKHKVGDNELTYPTGVTAVTNNGRKISSNDSRRSSSGKGDDPIKEEEEEQKINCDDLRQEYLRTALPRTEGFISALKGSGSWFPRELESLTIFL